ncbi:MAG: sigma-70 family RNA polymerase sigma factor [bacterium]|nr:sigma-70 family RNA polymerase sigma factor [bacterium]
MNNPVSASTFDPREKTDRYLPLDRRRATRFIDDWEPMVKAVLMRMRIREVDHALSVVFQKALKGLPDFRGESRLSSWLYRIAWREGLRQASLERKHDERKAPVEIAVDRPDNADDQLRTLERKETAATVRAAIAQLGLRDREVLALRHLEEMPFAQVADRLKISETAAKVRCHRALSRLRIVLEKNHD